MAVVLDAMKRTLADGPALATGAVVPDENEYLCRWDGCGINFASGEELYDHLCSDHVIRRPKHYGGLAAGINEGVRVSSLPRGPHGAVNSGDPARLYCHWKNCSVTVQKRDHMTSHIRIHINMKPYSCEQCDKKFKRTQDLKKHLRTHPGDKTKPMLKQKAALPAAPAAAAADATAATAGAAAAAAAPAKHETVARRGAPAARVTKKRKQEAVSKPAARTKRDGAQVRNERHERQLQELRELSSPHASEPEKQRAVAASLTLLADVHSAQVKPEFSEQLAERLDTISLILKDEKLLQHVHETVARSNINTSEQLGELNEFLEQVTSSITEQQMTMRMKQEEQPLSELVYTSMKPMFPPLPFEPGTEADFLCGPNYFSDVLDSAPQHFQEQKPLRYRRPQCSDLEPPFAQRSDPRTHMTRQALAPDAAGHLADNRRGALRHETPYAAPEMHFDHMFKDAPELWGNAPLLEAPDVGEEPDVSDALDYYLSQVETQMTAAHTLEVTSGLRTLINGAMEPELQAAAPEPESPAQYNYRKQQACQPENTFQHQYYQGPHYSSGHYVHTGHTSAVPGTPPLAQHPGVYTDYRAETHF